MIPKEPSLDRGIQFGAFALTETHTGSTENGVESGSKAVLDFRALPRYRRLISLELVSDSVQSCDAKSELSFPFQYVFKIHRVTKEEGVSRIKSQRRGNINLF